MKRIKRKLNQYGFSLIEIMVAVAIVGILTVIAIPQYQKYQRKALQNEAKMLLSNLYTIERTFSLNWGYGTTNLKQMGFKATGIVAYNAGWDQKYKDPIGCNTNDPAARSNCPGYNGPVPKAVDVDKIDIHKLCPVGGTPCGHAHINPEDIPDDTKVENAYRKVKFKIGASRSFSNSKQDVWTISHNKRLKNVKSGI